jgi:DNA-binding IclR family transcriptional regulator
MTVAAVDRALNIIEVLAGEPDGLELSMMAERLSLPLSATHRLLATLMDHHFVQRDANTSTFSLTLRMAQLAFRNMDCRQLPDVVQNALNRLAMTTGEYCRLAVVEADTLVWIARAQGATAGLRYEPDMGADVVLHTTATGKAWLATLPEHEAMRIVFAAGFSERPGFGPNAIRDIDTLRMHLDHVHKRGFALAVEEGEVGTVALAVPFRSRPDAAAPVVGTLSVAGPIARIQPDRYADFAEHLHEAAQNVCEVWTLRNRQSNRMITASAGSELHPAEQSLGAVG